MKKIKIIFLTAIMIAAGVAIGFHSYEKSQEPELSKLALADIEALTQGEGDSGTNANCPNGGYFATGNRTEERWAKWVKIELNANTVVDIAELEGKAEAGFKWERLMTTAYNCDNKNSNRCLVCNRYVLK